MTTEDLIDEIDWLIFEIKPGLELTDEHQSSLTAAGIECLHGKLSNSSAETLIEMLKNKRESIA